MNQIKFKKDICGKLGGSIFGHKEKQETRLIWDIYDRIFWELKDIITQYTMIFVSTEFYEKYAEKLRLFLVQEISESRNNNIITPTLFFYRTFIQQNIIFNEKTLYFFNTKRILISYDVKERTIQKPFGDKKGSFFCVCHSIIYLAQDDTIFSNKGHILKLPAPIRNLNCILNNIKSEAEKCNVFQRKILCNTVDKKYYQLLPSRENSESDELIFVEINESNIAASNYRQKDLNSCIIAANYSEDSYSKYYRYLTRTVRQKTCWSGMSFYLNADGLLTIDNNTIGSFSKKIENVVDFIGVEELSGISNIASETMLFYIVVDPLKPGIYNMYRYSNQMESSEPIYCWNFNTTL